MDNYLEINKNSWNAKVQTHLESEFYDMPSFLEGKTSLPQIDLDLLGDISGKTILHLQCHFGQDTISLSRMGAKVVGVDFSEEAVETAQKLANQVDADTTFICSDVYRLDEVLDQQFDIVYTSYGVIGWLPDMNRWAKIIQKFLKPGGKLIFAEFHPVVWMFDDAFEKVAYSYFNTGAIAETYEGTYANQEADLKQQYVMWNHSIGEVMGALLMNGIQIVDFKEYDYSPWPCFKEVKEIGDKRYIIPKWEGKLPMVYSIVGRK